MVLASGWELFYELNSENDIETWKTTLLSVGIEQKEDKQILKQLVEDEKFIKEWKARFDTASKALGVIAEMREEYES